MAEVPDSFASIRQNTSNIVTALSRRNLRQSAYTEVESGLILGNKLTLTQIQSQARLAEQLAPQNIDVLGASNNMNLVG
jgi:hypothetical protein